MSLSAIWEEKHQQIKTLKKIVTNRYIDGGGVWWHDRILIAIQPLESITLNKKVVSCYADQNRLSKV